MAPPTTGIRNSVSNQDKTIRILRANEYPHEIWFFLACLIALVALFRFLSFISSKVLDRRLLQRELETDCSRSKKLRFRNLPLAVINFYRVVAFRLTLNFNSFSLNLAEMVLTMMYIAALFTWTLINTTDVSGTKFDVNYWSNRAGVLIASQLPLITALGTKNNLISFITGVSYEKLNNLHRMVARVVFVLVWTHAGSKIYPGLLQEDLDQTWLRCGLLAASSFSSLCIISIRPVRARAYEFFFYAHVILVLLILVGAYVHTREFDYETYIWPSFIVWGADRTIRVLKLILFNYSYFGIGSGGTLDASIELLTPGCVRLTLKKPSLFRWSPGQFAYLIVPDVSTLPFECHPFTIASHDSLLDSGLSSSDSTQAGQSPKLKELTFLINVRDGFTKRLADLATRRGSVKVLLDGPYGQTHDLDLYNTIVFIAGGTGVSHTLPLLLDTIKRVRDGKSVCQRVTFIWCIRDYSNIQWISDILVSGITLAPDSMKIHIRVYVTGTFDPRRSLTDLHKLGAESASSAESMLVQTPTSEKVENLTTSASSLDVIAGLPSVMISQGRPLLADQLKEEADASRGAMWVTVCGSQSIASAVRKGLQFPVAGPFATLRKGVDVALHVESFGYA
ncbi:hypothetical protein GYMLUDRAFT_46056 [Collybiopsis luxurians FD-317 M1]|uniref:ferric-chelate reductase (NADPH) n=1 Tax=Collybiopsis luxurians FD-317 M1 TaxID=944289 RepID=A0A0D0C5N7_9AGAR|nr:hypothetical protein GYMLUDRAFT_46056 [Collybiopsis luxurians FD-317 M1]